MKSISRALGIGALVLVLSGCRITKAITNKIIINTKQFGVLQLVLLKVIARNLGYDISGLPATKR